MKFQLWIGLLLFGVLSLNAQSHFLVKGSVEDFHNATFLEGAEVQLGALKTQTDRKGLFRFKAVPKGTYSLLVSHPSCDPYKATLVVDSDKQLRVYLEHHTQEIEEVLVQGKSGSLSPGATVELSKNKIDRLAGETLAGALGTLSGIGEMKTGNHISKPIIHGLYGSRVALISGGARLEEQEWGVEHAPSVEPTSFQTLKVVKGASVLKYGGDAPGGMVVLEPRILPKKDTLLGNVSLSGISSGRGMKLGVNLAKAWENEWYIESTGTFKKLGDLSTPKYTLQNTGVQEQSFSFRAGKRSFLQGWELSYRGMNQQFGIFKGSHLGGPEDFYRAIVEGIPLYRDQFSYRIEEPFQEVEHHLASIEWYQRFSRVGKLSVRYDFQLNHRKEFDLRRGELKGLPSMDLRLLTHKLKLGHLLERDQWQLESGLSGGMQDNYPNPSTQARRLIPDYFRYDAGLFSALKYRMNSEFSFDLGARLDLMRYDAYKYYDQSEWDRRFASTFSSFEVAKSGSRILTRPVLDFALWSFNLGAEFKPSDKWNFALHFSQASRAPSAAELFADGLHHSAALIETGDLSLEKEVISHLSAEVEWKYPILEGFSIKAVPYLMSSPSFITQVPTGVQNSNRGVFMVWDYLQTRARIYGLDLDLNLGLLPQLNFRSSLSTLRGEDLTQKEPLILMQPTKIRSALEWTPSFAKGVYIQVENLSVMKQNHFPIRDIELSLIENSQVVARTLDLSSTPNAYSLWDLSIGKTFGKHFKTDLRVTNLFNKEYRDLMNRLRYFAPEQGRNIVLSLHYQF